MGTVQQLISPGSRALSSHQGESTAPFHTACNTRDKHRGGSPATQKITLEGGGWIK